MNKIRLLGLLWFIGFLWFIFDNPWFFGFFAFFAFSWISPEWDQALTQNIYRAGFYAFVVNLILFSILIAFVWTWIRFEFIEFVDLLMMYLAGQFAINVLIFAFTLMYLDTKASSPK